MVRNLIPATTTTLTNTKVTGDPYTPAPVPDPPPTPALTTSNHPPQLHMATHRLVTVVLKTIPATTVTLTNTKVIADLCTPAPVPDRPPTPAPTISNHQP